jgi:hypothetical protein
MPEYKVTILKSGQADVPGPEVYWMSHWFEWETLYFHMALIQGEGITAIINTGPPVDLSELNEVFRNFAGDRCQMLREENERPLAALKRAGVEPEDIQYILLTPLVSYANANVALFPAVKKIFISRRGWIEEFFAPEFPGFVPRNVLMSDDVVTYLTTKVFDRVHLVGEEEEVLPGIRMFWVGVHHRSSMAISVPTNKGRVVISDCFFKYKNIEDNIILGVTESVEECKRSYARIRREADITVPLYDPAVLDRFPGGVIG